VVTLALWLLSFFITTINFINLSTARAGMRAREVWGGGVAPLGDHALDFCACNSSGEALLMTRLPRSAAWSLVELCLPINKHRRRLDLSLDYRHQGGFLAMLIAASCWLGLLSGNYPAVVLSGFQPAQAWPQSRSPLGRTVRHAGSARCW